MQDQIYLDHLSTTPCDPGVAEIMWPYMTKYFANPSAVVHACGKKLSRDVEHARQSIAQMLNASEAEIIFTSGATESINMAIGGVAHGYAGKGRHIITAATEHSAVMETCKQLEKKGYELTILPVDANGLIDPAVLVASIRKDTILVAIMHANNETGVIHDITGIGQLCAENGIVFFCDTTQTVGKLELDVEKYQIDLCCFSAHKFYGPKGVGGLYTRKKGKRIAIPALLLGGGQEAGLRSGTLNVPGIMGMAKAFELSHEKPSCNERIASFGQRFEEALLQMGGIIINGRNVERLPGISSASFRFLEGQALLVKLNEKLCVSAGSSCSSTSGKPSPVLKAMGLGDQQAVATIRFSFGRFTTEIEFENAVAYISESLLLLREESHTWKMFSAGRLAPGMSWHHPLEPCNQGKL